MALVAVVVLVVAGATSLFAFGLSRDPSVLRSRLVGRPAPDFSLPALEGGGTVRLSDLRGQVVVINFWASWCLACREEHPNFVLAWDRYRDQGVVFLGIVYQDSRSSAMEYMREMGGDWPNVVDPDSRTALAYGVFGIPETFFIDARGVVRYKQIGATPYDLLVREVERLRSAQTGQTP
ncbi:MAG: TlpA family protein disulfide reductase [Actinomycetota bacterium]